jgi:hypothetical protein
VQWRILPLLSPTEPSIVWRTQMEAMALEEEEYFQSMLFRFCSWVSEWAHPIDWET